KICASTGEPPLQIIIYRDETRRMRAFAQEASLKEEQVRQESEKRLNSILNSLEDVVWSMSAITFEPLYLNEAAEKVYGRPLKELFEIPNFWLEIVHPDDWKIVRRFVDVLLEGKPEEVEYRVVWPDGEVRWLQDRGRPVLDDRGRVVRLDGIAADITNRRESEEQRKVFSWLALQLAEADSVVLMAILVAQALNDLFRWDSFFFSERVPNKQDFRSVYFVDIIDGNRQIVSYKEHSAEEYKPLGKLLEGEPFLLNREDEDDFPLSRFGDTTRVSQSLIFAPISFGGEVFAILSAQSYQPRRYKESDLTVLKSLADMVAPALQRAQAEENLRRSEEHFRAILEDQTELICRWLPGGKPTYINEAYCRYFGRSRQELLGHGHIPYIFEEDREKVEEHIRSITRDNTVAVIEHRVVLDNGELRWQQWTDRAVLDKNGTIIEFQSVGRDISDRKKAEERLLFDAMHDALTGLPNRSLFLDRLSLSIARRRRKEDYLFAVLVLDLDRFKVVNDSLGHLAGDQLLIEFSKRLHDCMRPGDTVSRLGGDEFAILLDDVKNLHDANRVAERIHAALKQPFVSTVREVFTTASMGIALSDARYERPEDILRDADTALYRAKSLGKARHQVFDKDMHDRAVKTLELENDLRRAVERQAFELHYQPIVDLKSGRITGFEALVRWPHSLFGLIYPKDFVSLAEETGLVIQLGAWVLGEACRQMSEWQSTFKTDPPLSVSVNLSGKQFEQPQLAEQIAQIIKDTNLLPGTLKLEITESVLMDKAESTTEIFMRLNAINVQLHMDDFGTGYSSLSYLHELPI
ncbi:MAG: EAL domain-containing protein, partial [bacterium]